MVRTTRSVVTRVAAFLLAIYASFATSSFVSLADDICPGPPFGC